MKGIFKKALPAALVMAMAAFHTTVHADTNCKGLNKTSCSATTSCTWVSSYVKKNGTKVDGYCRVNSAKKQSTTKQKTEKKTKQAVKEKTKEKKKAMKGKTKEAK